MCVSVGVFLRRGFGGGSLTVLRAETQARSDVAGSWGSLPCVNCRFLCLVFHMRGSLPIESRCCEGGY